MIDETTAKPNSSETFGFLTLLSARSYNTGYMARFARSNRLSPTSYSPMTLCEIRLERKI